MTGSFCLVTAFTVLRWCPELPLSEGNGTHNQTSNISFVKILQQDRFFLLFSCILFAPGPRSRARSKPDPRSVALDAAIHRFKWFDGGTAFPRPAAKTAGTTSWSPFIQSLHRPFLHPVSRSRQVRSRHCDLFADPIRPGVAMGLYHTSNRFALGCCARPCGCGSARNIKHLQHLWR